MGLECGAGSVKTNLLVSQISFQMDRFEGKSVRFESVARIHQNWIDLEWILRQVLFSPLPTIFPTGLSYDRN